MLCALYWQRCGRVQSLEACQVFGAQLDQAWCLQYMHMHACLLRNLTQSCLGQPRHRVFCRIIQTTQMLFLSFHMAETAQGYLGYLCQDLYTRKSLPVFKFKHCRAKLANFLCSFTSKQRSIAVRFLQWCQSRGDCLPLPECTRYVNM